MQVKQKIISSKVVGPLKQLCSGLWKSKKIEVPFFDYQKFSVLFHFGRKDDINGFMPQADLALTHFLQRTVEDRNAISEHVYKNCMGFLDGVVFVETDIPLRLIKDKNDIWKYIYPGGISIKRRDCSDGDIYVTAVCIGDWDKEYGHGLQFIFRQGKKITRISDYDSHLTDADAYDIPDEEDELLSAFHCD